MNSDLGPSTPSANLLLGPLLLGTMFSFILQGVLYTQVYHYYITFQNDRKYLKWLVFYICVAESLHTAFSTHIVYEALVLDYGQNRSLQKYPTFIPVVPIVTVLISTPIQFMVAWRIRLIQQSVYLPLFICLLSVISFAGGIATGIRTQLFQLFAEAPHATHMFVLVWMISAAACDLVMSGALSWTLYRRKTGMRNMDLILTKIITLTMQTGIAIAIFAVVCLVTLRVLPDTNSTNYVFSVMLAKLYANFLMASLNARGSYKDSLEVNDRSVTIPVISTYVEV
ncbi:hypothetical protein BJ165DRAFT_291301 [Panaeolus papilionaceus]|nr:hypothetical protein BJ165DRAFT_291301 [Panaeolus papilionaceus]